MGIICPPGAHNPSRAGGGEGGGSVAQQVWKDLEHVVIGFKGISWNLLRRLTSPDALEMLLPTAFVESALICKGKIRVRYACVYQEANSLRTCHAGFCWLCFYYCKFLLVLFKVRVFDSPVSGQPPLPVPRNHLLSTLLNRIL